MEKAINNAHAADAMIDPSLWAATGGLNGLVIFALFIALGLFLKAQASIYEMHRSDLIKILDMHSSERKEWVKIVDERQRETNEAMRQMTIAVHELSMRSRRYDKVSNNETN